MNLIFHLRVAGGLLALIAVSALFTPRILAYRENLAKVEPTVREIFYIHNLYVTLFVIAFALPCLFAPAEMSTTSLGRFFSGFLALAWGLRFFIQMFYHNRKIKRAWPVMNVVFSATFVYLGAVFGFAAFGG